MYLVTNIIYIYPNKEGPFTFSWFKISVLKDGKASVILASPESLQHWDEVLATKYASPGKLCAVVVDEAHLLVEWMTFRPQYTELQDIKPFLGKQPWVLTTATASKDLLPRLLAAVGLEEKDVVVVAAVPDR